MINYLYSLIYNQTEPESSFTVAIKASRAALRKTNYPKISRAVWTPWQKPQYLKDIETFDKSRLRHVKIPLRPSPILSCEDSNVKKVLKRQTLRKVGVVQRFSKFGVNRWSEVNTFI